MNIEDVIKDLGKSAKFELLMRRFAMAPIGEKRAHAKQAVLLHVADILDKVPHASDCSSNNRGVPELLGPCDCKVQP